VAPFVYGLVMALAVPSLFALLGWVCLDRLSPWPLVAFAVHVLLLKSTFAVRALGQAARVMHKALVQGDLPSARQGLRSLCSRDPSALGPGDLTAATIESVAENTSDSYVAPLFYYAFFGLPGALAYRAVNTLDAMVGYHGKYEYLGKASARLDDVLNVVPARLTALLFLVAGFLCGADVAHGVRTLLRDARRTESPNAGYPMATMAGLLGVALEKEGHYRLGEARRPLAVGFIGEALRIFGVAVAVTVLLVATCALTLGHGGGAFGG
jgi:adenosylcobinamide-phosphate synthase